MKDQSEAETLKLVFPTMRLFSIPPRLTPHTHTHNLALHDRKTGFCVQASASSPRKRAQLLRKSAFVCVCVLVKKKQRVGTLGRARSVLRNQGGKFSCHQARHCPKPFKVYSCGRRTKKTPQPAELCLSACAGGRKKKSGGKGRITPGTH